MSAIIGVYSVVSCAAETCSLWLSRKETGTLLSLVCATLAFG
jgi:hypothetical protein